MFGPFDYVNSFLDVGVGVVIHGSEVPAMLVQRLQEIVASGHLGAMSNVLIYDHLCEE